MDIAQLAKEYFAILSKPLISHQKCMLIIFLVKLLFWISLEKLIENMLVFLKMRADNYLENEFLSRDLNFRPFDDSSIFKTGNAIKYFKRLFSKDGDAIFENSDLKKTNLLVMNHFSSHNSNFFFKTFENKMNYINIVRHPIHIFDHWVYLFTSLKNNNPRVKNF